MAISIKQAIIKLFESFVSKPFEIHKEVLEVIVNDESDKEGSNTKYYLTITLLLRVVNGFVSFGKLWLIITFIKSWVGV